MEVREVSLCIYMGYTLGYMDAYIYMCVRYNAENVHKNTLSLSYVYIYTYM